MPMENTEGPFVRCDPFYGCGAVFVYPGPDECPICAIGLSSSTLGRAD